MSLKYLTRRTALNATTKNPALCNFNHLRSIPRTWLIRRSKNDPKLKSVRVTDRIKFWNIVPGDHIRLRGDEDNTIHEVLSINRLSNRVFLKGPASVRAKNLSCANHSLSRFIVSIQDRRATAAREECSLLTMPALYWRL